MDEPSHMSVASEGITRKRSGEILELVLIVSDSAPAPFITNTLTEIRVTIGVGDDFDQVLDVTRDVLNADQIAFLHRLWSDDTFPRTFTRIGDELIISARK